MTAADDVPATSLPPVLLVDVDGVLNALSRSPQRRAESPSKLFELEFTARGFPICVPIGTRERMATLETLFDCVWATSWEDKATTHLAPEFGFGARWPVIRFHDDFPDAGTWKLPGVRRFAERPEHVSRPLAWIDDDIEPDALEWAARRTRSGTPTLMVRPDADIGLTSRQFQRLLTFHSACQQHA
jgi:HAD domain in Swiss Army Knife RNA repair proteins